MLLKQSHLGLKQAAAQGKIYIFLQKDQSAKKLKRKQMQRLQLQLSIQAFVGVVGTMMGQTFFKKLPAADFKAMVSLFPVSNSTKHSHNGLCMPVNIYNEFPFVGC